MKIKFLLSEFVFFVCLTVHVFAQDAFATANPSDGGWTSNPFDQKVFIENKGQFSVRDGSASDGNESSTILFGASIEGVELYFTSKGLTYKHNELVPMAEEEKEESPSIKGGSTTTPFRTGAEEKEKKRMKSIPHYLSIEWVGSNPNAEIIAEEPVSFYYTYGSRDNATIKASAFKKIIYKNLYPNIDVEYIFPKDIGGIKYSLLLHPGANPADIRMKYIGAENISLDSEGNAVIKSSFGNFIDHAPKTFYKDNGNPIASSFSIDNNIVSFYLPTYQNSSPTLDKRVQVYEDCEQSSEGGVIIDPWTTNPNFIFNSAYDVNYDLNGNVYIYGSFNDIVLAKLNSSGAIQWVFVSPGFGSNNYGDFALDEVSGTSYLGEGVGFGARVLKVNTLGVQTGVFSGNIDMQEISRMEYNRCLNKIVVAGGGSSTYMAAMLDTNLVSMTPVNVLSAASGWQDIALLATDNSSSFCYMASAYNFAAPTSDNFLIKCPIPSLLPLSFSVYDGHKFGELRSAMYFKGPANGINGMAVSPNWLYTYDSDSLKRWDKNTGALISKMDISPLTPSFYTGSGSPAIRVFWSGITADACDNIYVGLFNSIKEYNSSLSLINTFILPDTVYDVKLGPNNKLYACGKGFVTEINVPPVTGSPAFTVTQTPVSGCSSCNGTAAVTAISSACTGTLSGSAYSWNTSPVQTAQIATGLCPGTYSVTVTTGTTNCFNGFIATGTVTVIGGSGALSASVTAIPAVCGNNNGSATIIVAVGTPPYTYNWTPSGGTNTSATGLSAGTYTVITTDAGGCSSTNTVIVTSTGSVTATAGPISTICAGQIITLTASGGGNYSWSNGSTNATINVFPTSTATYSVIVSIGSCSDTAFATVTVSPSPSVSVAGSISLCIGQNATLTASGGLSYSWLPTGQTTTMITVSPTGTATYTVIGTNAGGCIASAIAAVTVTPTPVVTPSSAALCMGDNVTLTASGGVSYSWSSAGQTTTTIVVSPTASTTYTVTVTAANSCTNFTTISVTVSPPPTATVSGVATICSGQTAMLTATGGGNYSWNNGNTNAAINVSPTANTTYSVIVSIGTCKDTASASVTVNPSPFVSVSGNTVLCAGDIATLTASGSTNYSWSNGNTNSIINVSPGATTTYTVTTSNGSCTSAASVTVVVSPPPNANATGAIICAGQNATLIASGGGNYLWNNGTTTASVNVSPTTNTSYSVIVSIGSCTDTASATVVVNPTPTAAVSGNVTITTGSSTTLSASGGTSYVWGNGANGNTIAVSPPVTTGYCITVSNGNCTDTACVTVFVEPIDCSPAVTGELYLPNAFSPNGDGENDALGLYFGNVQCIKTYELVIYNRWGEKVFSAQGGSASGGEVVGWDGTYKGKLMNTAVFVYYMKVTFITGNETVRKGNVSLMR